MEVSRKQRLSDGTLTFAGVRYEVPNAYRTLLRPTIRVSRWDLSSVDLVDPRRGIHLATLFPIDKEANPDRKRRTLVELNVKAQLEPRETPAGIAPLMKQYMAEYAATGLPPAYIPHDTNQKEQQETEP